jgi:5'-nucleotidase
MIHIVLLFQSRFPVISGFRVSWDSRRPPGKRVLGVWLLNEMDVHDTEPIPLHEEQIKCLKGGRMFKIVTREYMAQGHDGFLSLKGQKYLIDDESGQLMNCIVRKYLLGWVHFAFDKEWLLNSDLGCLFVNKMSRVANRSTTKLHSNTWATISREKTRQETWSRQSQGVDRWKQAACHVFQWTRSKAHYQDHLNVTAREHMGNADCFDGQKTRSGQAVVHAGQGNGDLLVVSPGVDGRLKDEGRT